MLAFLLEVVAWTEYGRFYLFALFMIIIWVLWGIRITLVSYYRPWKARWEGRVSVIIPVVDEPIELFTDVLSRIVSQGPDEVVVIVNGPRNRPIERVCRRAGVRCRWTKTPGKRRAIKIGLEYVTGDVVVLVDSDTIWTPDTLEELVKPFNDAKVGGVTTRQRILGPDRSVLTRWADWLESIRNEYSMPAMSVLGTVGCLPGRTIAFRRSILEGCMDRFLSERFLGVFLEVSDDRTLTSYTLKAGYKTVYQSTSLVYTDAPTELPKLVRQQYRWARGSQYNTLRMLPWMLRRAPVLATFYLADILVPFVLVGSFVAWVVSLLTRSKAELYGMLPLPDQGWLAALVVLSLGALLTTVSLGVRFGKHFAFSPSDVRYLPIFMFINTFVLMPVRVLGFLRMAHNAGWGTRSNAFAGEQAHNPFIAVPYVLGGSMLITSVLLGV